VVRLWGCFRGGGGGWLFVERVSSWRGWCVLAGAAFEELLDEIFGLCVDKLL